MDLVLSAPELKDTRFTVFQSWIFRAVRWKWGSDPRWGAMEAKQLWNLLQEMPQLSEKDLCLALRNLLNSSDIPAMQRPGYWLPRLESYMVHEHNTFGRNPNANSSAIAASQFLDKKRNHSCVPATDGATVPVAESSRRVGLRALGYGSRPILPSGD